MSAKQILTPRETLERFKESHPELGSARQIAEVEESVFVKTYAGAFPDGARQARQVHKTAVAVNEKTALIWANIKDAVASPYFRGTLFNNIPESFIKHQESIPGYDRLFGNLDFIECDHCRSIFGPAAYFVDLMRFVEQEITQKSANGELSKLRLEQRRPDLPRIRLDCHNSHDLIPYIDLVNEALEAIISGQQNADPYQVVEDSDYPMNLPFNLPLAQIRSYLKQLKNSLHQIYKAFEINPGDKKNPITREFLELSPKEFSLIVDEISRPEKLTDYYGLDVTLAGRDGLENVDNFLQQTGLDRKALNDLIYQDLDRHEVNAGLSRLFFVNNVPDGLGCLTVEVDKSDPAKPYEKLVNLSYKKLDLIYRFLRLARKLDWSFAELDWALRSLAEPYKPEKVLKFDGRNDYIAAQNVKGLAANRLTIEAWINPAGHKKNPILAKGKADDHRTHFLFWVDADGRLALYGDDDVVVRSLNVVEPGVFTHVAVTADGGEAKFYINGRFDSTVPLEKPLTAQGSDLEIGRNLNDSYFEGIIKEVRLWDEARDQATIEANRYRRFTGREKHLAGYWSLTERRWNRLPDLSNNQNDLVFGGEEFVTQPKWVYRDLVLEPAPEPLDGRAYQFDGQDQYLAARPVHIPDMEQLTLEAWVTIADQRQNHIIVVGHETNFRTQFMLFLDASGRLNFKSTSLGAPITGQKHLVPGEATHVAVTLSATELKLFVNGALDKTVALQAPPMLKPQGETAAGETSPGGTLLVGRSLSGSYFAGQLSEIRLWDRARSQDELAVYMHRSLAGGELGLIGYWPLRTKLEDDGLAHDHSYSGNDLYLGGLPDDYMPARVDSDLLLPEPPIAAEAAVLHLDGDNDVITIWDPANAGLGQYERLTLAFWFKADDVSLAREQILLSQGDGEAGLGIYLKDGRLIVLAWNAGYELSPVQEAILSTERIKSGAWHHLAVVNDESVTLDSVDLRAYLDGREIGQQDGFRLCPVGPIYLGGMGREATTRFQGAYAGSDSHHRHYFSGQMADFRLWQSIKTAADIDRQRLAAADETAADLITYLPMAEGEGRELFDKSGNGRHGELQENNMALFSDGRAHLANAYSHYAPEGAEGESVLRWSDYVFSGRLYLADPDGGIGVTTFSRHPESQDYCYVLCRDRANPAFHLVAHPKSIREIDGQLESGVVPQANAWYRFRLQAEDDGTSTHIRAKVWLDGQDEPADFSIDASDAGRLRLTAGTVGFWATGPGAKYADDLQVRPVSGASPALAADLMADNFEAYADGAEPAGWRDTTVEWVDEPDDGRFKTIGLDGGVVFGIEGEHSNLEEVHTHYDSAQALAWKDYIFAGRFRLSGQDDAFGLTFYSGYPDGRAEYYRIRRTWNRPAFYLDSRPLGRQPLTGQVDSGVTPAPDSWYRFHIEVEDRDGRTGIRAKIWPLGDDQPQAFQIDAYDDGPERLTSGTIGLWSLGSGHRVVDDLLVDHLAVQAPWPSMTLLSESFEGYDVLKNPTGWKNTQANNSPKEDDKLFRTIDFDETQVLWSEVKKQEYEPGSHDNIHAHYVTPDVLNWTNYAYSGRLHISEKDGGVGVTFFSQYPEIWSGGQGSSYDRYYCLRRLEKKETFHIACQPDAPRLKGKTDSGVLPERGKWYRFLVEVEDSGKQTDIRAKVWEEGTAEPGAFQIVAYDRNSDRLTSGAVGVWSAGPGSKLFDDFKVEHQPLLAESFAEHGADQSPDKWAGAISHSVHQEESELIAVSDVKNNMPRWRPVVDYPLLPHPLSRLALQFDGRRQYAAVNIKGLGLEAFTLEAWVNPAIAGQAQPIVRMDQAQPTMLFGLSDTGHLRLALDDEPVLTDAAALTLDAFSHVALSVAGAKAALYVNGRLASTVDLPAPLKLEDGLLEIGRDASGNYFTGRLKEVRLWKSARDAAGIEAGLYQRLDEIPVDLAGYWTFDEAEGALALDASAAANHWRLGGLDGARQPTFFQPHPAPHDPTTLRPHRVLTFSEQADLIAVPDSGDAEKARQRQTVELWFKVDDRHLSSRKQILYRQGDDQRGLVLYVHDGKLIFGGFNTLQEESDWAGAWLSSDRISSGKWHHAALVLDGRREVRDDSLQAYLDGKVVDTGSGSQLWPGDGSGSLGAATGPGRFHDGDLADLGGHNLAGQIMALRLWNTARTPSDISTNWCRRLEGPLPQLALWWYFDDLDGLEIRDGSGNDRTGSIRHLEQIQPAGAPVAYDLPRVTLDESTIDQIAGIKRLKQTHNLSIDKLCALWHAVKASGKADQSTLYDQVFNPKGIVADQWDSYLDEPIRWDKTGETDRDRDRKVRSRLMGALRVSSDDLNRIAEKLSGDETLIKLDNDYLTRLYRLARAPGILRLPVADFFRLLDLAGLKDINSVQDFLKVTQQAAWMKKSGIDVWELDFLANDRQSKRVSVAYSESTIRDLADDLSRQSADFLVQPEAFVSDEIGELLSRETLDLLRREDFGFIESNGAVTFKYMTPADLAPLAEAQAWPADFEVLGAGIFEKLSAGGFVDEHGIVLKSDEKAFSDTGLLELFVGEPKPSLETLATIRDSLTRRLKAQDKIGTTLIRMRDAQAAAILVGLSDLYGVTSDVMPVLITHFEAEMDARRFLRLMMGIREESPIPDGITEYLYKLNKVLYLIAQFAFGPADAAALLQNPAHFQVKDVLNPDVEDLDNLYTYRELRDTFAGEDGKLIRLLGRAQEDTAGLVEEIHDLTYWERRQIQSLLDYFGDREPDNQLARLKRLKGCFDLVQTMGVDVDFLIQLSDTGDLDYDFYKKQSSALLPVLRAGYDDDKWLKVYQPIRDQLAVQRRDALLSLAMLVLGSDYEGRKDPDVLYEYLLLDVQMGSETQTSRIVQATASLQLYVQRCLMNLEKGVNPESIPADQWQWMKNYRVWEANRKVFLYPENYIEPELRNNKSPLFEQLEQELMQEEINQASVEKAYTNYLDRFAQIANLKIVGSYYHVETNPELERLEAAADDAEAEFKANPGDDALAVRAAKARELANAKKDELDKILYLVGRTTTEPSNYYYRELINGERWLPWKKIELAIKSDFATPVYAFNKLFIFWVEFTKLVKSVDIRATSKDKNDGKAVDKQGYLTSTLDPAVRLQKNVDLYQATVKYSYYNFDRSWIQPQTFLELEKDLRENEYIKPEWQRVYAQRSLNLTPVDEAEEGAFGMLAAEAETETNAKVLAIGTDTKISGYVPADDMHALTWSFWVRFINANPKGQVEKIVTRSVDLFDYENGLRATVTNNVTPIPGAAEALAAAETKANTTQAAADEAQLKAEKSQEAADEARAEADRLEKAADEAEAKSKAKPEDTALAKAATDARQTATSARVAATQAQATATADNGGYEAALLKANEAAAVFEKEKLKPKYESKDLTLRYRIGDQEKTAEMTLDYGWQHVALTLDYDRYKQRYGASLYKNGQLGSEKDIPTRVLAAQGELAVARLEQNSENAFTSQMSEFRLWSLARRQQTIADEMGERKRGQEMGLLFHLPLNEKGSGIELAESNLAFRFVEPPIQIPVSTEPRERLILFYGDQYRSVRDTMQDHNFSLWLWNRPFYSYNYDLDLSVNALHVARTYGLSINDYAAEGESTTSRLPSFYYYNPSWWNYSWRHDAAQPPGDDILLGNLSRMEATLFDVNNQPGWYLLDTGEEQFLVTAGIDGLETADKRLKFIVPKSATPGQPPITPITMYFDADPKLVVTGTAPTFHLERLSTMAIHRLSQRLFAGGLDKLLTLEAQGEKEWDFGKYNANKNLVPETPADSIDFDGANGLYYREIFFHIPFFIANQLNANQKFAEAQKWYHAIFNPTAQEANGEDGNKVNAKDRYWRYLPFRGLDLESLADMLSNPDALAEYREDPFDPHAIARLRLNAYQKAIVMKYIDNLLDWGDYLFSQDTRESIGEAVPLYVLAYNLLGPKPEARLVRDFEEVGAYSDIRQEHGLKVPEFLAEAEKMIDILAKNGRLAANPHSNIVTNFCVIENELFMGYWDRVADRLYKIRHSLNIEGVFRSLALFDPPLDPMALVNAVAGGRDLGSALSDLGVPVPHYRYAFMLEQAREMAGNVIDLGSALLAALESRDAEKLAIMQNTHEHQLLDLMMAVKENEKRVIEETIEALGYSRKNVAARQSHYEKLIENGLSGHEEAELTLLGLSLVAKATAGVLKGLGEAVKAVPESEVGANGVGGSPKATIQFGGKNLAGTIKASAEFVDTGATVLDGSAAMIAKSGEYERRLGGWEFEKEIAKNDLDEIDKQIVIAKLQRNIASQELAIHDKTIQQNRQIADFYRDKFSTKDLYSWMISRLSGLYFQAYKLAYDMAKSAEKALQFELPTNQSYISFGHWDSLKKGLLAGESLLLELNRMEKSHLDQDSRFMEIEKTISMKREMPLELATLKAQGNCDFHLSEALFNRDFPGHYCRLIKTIAISVKADVDPYDSVNASLIQLGNRTLLEPSIEGVHYLMGVDGAEQPESSVLRSNWRANQRIAISKPDQDRGMFTLNFFLDDRYFPFEGTGAISYWRLEMPRETNRLDLDTIEDVIIHLQYTSKSDHGPFREAVMKVDDGS